MKSINNKYHLICDFHNILKAHKKSRVGKRHKPDVLEFSKSLNINIYKLAQELKDGTYRPGEYKFTIVKWPKVRLIIYLPYRDRLVQRVLVEEVLIPLLEPLFIRDSYANQKGKGTHDGIQRVTGFFQDYYNKHGVDGWIYAADISKYFASMVHDVLREMLYPRIKDKKIIWLIDLFIDSINAPEVQERMNYYNRKIGHPEVSPGRGLPAGNVLFQMFGVFYLNGLDDICKEDLKLTYYGRFMDDFIFLHHDLNYVLYSMSVIENYVESIGLTLHRNSQRMPIKNGHTFIGWHFYLTEEGKVIRKISSTTKTNTKNSIKRLTKDYKEGRVEFIDVKRSVDSRMAHAKHGHTYRWRKSMFSRLILQRKDDV